MFKPKSPVWLKKIGKEGIIDSEVSPGLYRVFVGAFAIECKEKDLKPLKNPKTPFKPVRKEACYSEPDPNKKMSIDLHGKTVEEAIRILDEALSRALFEGYGYLEIVHGVGTGRVRAAVHRHLNLVKCASRYQLDSTNTGITHVYFST